jgi:CubicO group peptidase (beta-lactamase class C family)
MKSAELVDMLARVAAEDVGIRAITLVRHGTVVLDVRVAPFSAGDLHDIFSCTKSVLSALVGIAIARGELPGIDTPVLDFFPDYDVAILDDHKRAMTLEHLLTMTSGLDTQDSYLYEWAGLKEMRASSDWTQFVLDLPMAAAPGTRFEYSNGVSQLVAIILQRATGKTLEEYAREHLFGPIGITRFQWDGQGPVENLGFSGLRLDPLDMARLGYLYLRHGEWNGTQVVPAAWVETSTSPHPAAGTLADNYGYLWWVDDDVFMMQGSGGQFVYVMPDLDLVAVFTGAVPRRLYFHARSLLADYIRPSVMSDEPLPPDPTAVSRLDSLAQALAVRRSDPRPVPETAHAVSGRHFDFDHNAMGLYRMILNFEPGSPECDLRSNMGMMTVSMVVGLDGAFRFTDIYPHRWACRGQWIDDHTFVVEEEAIGKVVRREATLKFSGDALTLEIYDPLTNVFHTFTATATPPPAE